MYIFAKYYYWILKYQVMFGYWLYARKMQVHGLRNIPWNKPVIFACNHQNAFVDPILIASFTPRAPHFITRGDVFKKKIANAFFRGIRMIPIFRGRDGLRSVYKSQEAIDETVHWLSVGRAVVIFPEGTQKMIFSVRPLQKGISRMTFQLLEKMNYKTGLHIVPVGIQYEDYGGYEARTIVTFGKPMTIDHLKDKLDAGVDQKTVSDELLEDIREIMKPLVVHIEEENYEETYKKWQSERKKFNDLRNQLLHDQYLVAKAEGKNVDPPKYHNGLWQQVLSFIKTVWRMVSFPLNFIPALVTDKIAGKLIKDPHFYPSIHFTIAIHLFPLVYFIYFVILMLIV